ncbi:imelysin family protein [Aquimarina aquimarini]|uniref:imelysin family protein n=1 Tax=Aquimarina aquimarini TaxID=1191734 RepID=UPI000D552F06|nr:imelysin family protein [Aquimarina aquimarini]
MKKLLFLFVAILFVVAGCSSSDDTNSDNPGTDTFNRKALLENIADNIAIPAYKSFKEEMANLKTATSEFVTTADESNLVKLRTAWLDAYVSWQSVSMFEIGKAEEISFRNFMNVYPVTTTEIEKNITDGGYDLNSVSKQDEQGFGALDYLLNGLADSDTGIVAFYSSDVNATKYKTYLSDVVERMDTLTTQVVNDWTGDYRDSFVNNSGSSATSSLDKLVNDFLFHYEKHLRAGKIGIPAGVFSNTTFNEKVEAFYKKDASKALFNANLTALQDFFNGKHFGSTTTGESLKTYLDFLNTIKEEEDLSTLINNQFNLARTEASNLADDFSAEVRTNNNLMLDAYKELQKNVVFLKVDMLSALSIRVDFVDADGD